MAVHKATLCMSLVACCCGALLGAQWSLQGVAAGPSQALVRYTGWLSVAPHVLVATLLAWGVTRCRQVHERGRALSPAAAARRARPPPTLPPPPLPMACSLGGATGKTALGPNAQLNLFHDGNALLGCACCIALHGSGAAWPLLFAVAGRLLVTGCQTLRLRRGVAASAVWAYAAAALLLNSLSEGASAAHWCDALLGADTAARCMPLARAMDRFAGVAPVHYTVGLAFRYTLMRFVRWVHRWVGRRMCMWASRRGVVVARVKGVGAGIGLVLWVQGRVGKRAVVNHNVNTPDAWHAHRCTAKSAACPSGPLHLLRL